jgi:hypothetical protein
MLPQVHIPEFILTLNLTLNRKSNIVCGVYQSPEDTLTDRTEREAAKQTLYQALFDAFYNYKKQLRQVTNPDDMNNLLNEFSAQAMAAQTAAMDATMPTILRNRIMGRAQFDAYKRLADEGIFAPAEEHWLLIDRKELGADILWSTGKGDIKDNTVQEAAYIPVELPETGILLHVYYGPTVEKNLARAMAAQLAQESKIGPNATTP